jgi:hypothetical protein
MLFAHPQILGRTVVVLIAFARLSLREQDALHVCDVRRAQ